MDELMRIEERVRALQCEKYARLTRKGLSKNKHLEAFVRIYRHMCRLLTQELTMEVVLEQLSGKIREDYREEWFDLPFLKERYAVRDLHLLHRFLEWFYRDVIPFLAEPEFAGKRMLKANVRLTVLDRPYTVDVSLLGKRKDGSYQAFLLSYRNSGEISEIARTPANRTEYDPALLAAQLAVSQAVGAGRVEVNRVCLKNGKDQEFDLTDFRYAGRQTADSNLFTLHPDFPVLEHMDQGLSMIRKMSCRDCPVAEFCQLPAFTAPYVQATTWEEEVERCRIRG